MKLYEVMRNTTVQVNEPGDVLHGLIVNFKHIDGMYSYCTLPSSGDVVHLAAWTNVDIFDPQLNSDVNSKQS